ncbi:Protein GLUTAMINE DUMPER like [Actinidia chinensis var. chinensis]|uniref:Protein GLUTAMINE DUMPER like n=1 Tax=Actinidia chinensis var. chinensis TaxID=1590841 RepID=A0A2R6RYG8_ACTCC|nr:Protein GLUTAMINE DUMPER like [Actinidia chinensis var. chinensis]
MTSTTDATATATTTTGLHRWNSPIPYLFGGLALMIGLIALALVILACSHKKPTSTSNSSNGAEENPTRATHVVEMEPRIVVIMAGDDHPMYLAKPVGSTLHGDQQV